jgi:hypothetical protein
MAKGGGGQTIVVAGGSGGGGTKDGNGGSSSPKTPKDPLSGGKLNVDDQMFWMVMIGAGALAVAAHVYTSNPALLHDFLAPFQKLGQPAQPAAQAPQQQQPSQQVAPPQTSFENPMGQDPYSQQAGGMYPQQGAPNPGQQFPNQYGQQYGPTFGQGGSIAPEQYPMQQSFYTIDSSDGMIRDY